MVSCDLAKKRPLGSHPRGPVPSSSLDPFTFLLVSGDEEWENRQKKS